MKKSKKLRSGYTTGACAAAAAKAAAQLLLAEQDLKTDAVTSHELTLNLRQAIEFVEIPFPDGSRKRFRIHNSKIKNSGGQVIAMASVIKDAGDDPDVTDKAEIVAEARLVQGRCRGEVPSPPFIKGGRGVGIVTKPGLSVPVGEPAINPVPRQMIKEAAAEAILESCRGTACRAPAFEIAISVPNGEELAKKTLNHRLGIVDGVSILGTTGIVRPVSAEAWTATIASSMDVAKAMGNHEIVLSAGRTSEKAHMIKYNLPEEAYVLMGDYMEYSLQEAKRRGFKKIHLCAQWAKMVKIAMATPQTHVRFGAIDIKKSVGFLNSLGIDIPRDYDFNTAREIFEFIQPARGAGANGRSPLWKICNSARKYAEEIASGIPVIAYLVSYDRRIIAADE